MADPTPIPAEAREVADRIEHSYALDDWAARAYLAGLAAGRTAAAPITEVDLEVLDAANVWRRRYGSTSPEFHTACESLVAAVDARRAARVAEHGPQSRAAR